MFTLTSTRIEKDVARLDNELRNLNSDVFIRVGVDSTPPEVLSKHRLKQGYVELQLSCQRILQTERRMRIGLVTAAVTGLAAWITTLFLHLL